MGSFKKNNQLKRTINVEQQLYFNFFMTFVYQFHQQKTLVFGECFFIDGIGGIL